MHTAKVGLEAALHAACMIVARFTRNRDYSPVQTHPVHGLLVVAVARLSDVQLMIKS